MTISILGCGWFGQAFANALITQGITVKGSTTSPHKLAVLQNAGITPYLIDLASNAHADGYASFFTCDVLMVAVPPRTRQQPAESFIGQMERLIGLVQQHGVRQVIFISATSVYAGNCGSVDERNEPVPDNTSGEALVAAERMFREQSLFRTTVVRFGGLIGPGRDPGRFFAGKRNVPNGLAPVNLIHLTDCIGVCLAILYKQWYGYTLNACAPQHPSRKEFYTRASQRAGLEVPEFADELLSAKIINSIYAEQELGYAFQEEIA